ncbi:MAG: hypothetical protein CMF51_05475 [Legionellales bacterium]|nr:hypothetical protein [Legionellales bacterium]|tara:strand:- start:3590 stop:3817 length:228 start_codon:yes stop_codon:yes gene_type:complete
MYHQLNLWINELQTQFNLSIDQIVALSGIARATIYRILSGQSVSERTRHKLMVVYVQMMASDANTRSNIQQTQSD